MGHIETERKFLVKDDSYKNAATEHIRMTQGYICNESGRTVRVRKAGDRGWLTIKGPSTDDGLSRFEWETSLSEEDTDRLLQLCATGLIDKVRHIVPYGGHRFEVDEFLGDNLGLTVAEIELQDAEEPFSRPEWLSEEVTGDRRYYNSMLASSPFSAWEKQGHSAKACL